ncbi:MAG: rod shape-determining protein MreD [Candidatus Cloacimonetes bacterium HGW-Cloacimonetes-1]|jgi:rod shape-determining protein MreD|nr:MAG: rod shape-determining protein MreD [Candidatus Cloacimonetes bacterium HGW-Cloacimonetes-1]
MAFKYLGSFLLGLVFLYLQWIIMPFLQIGGVTPNILLPWLIYTVWNRQFNVALVSVFVIALLYDVTYPLTFGVNSLIFVLLCVGIDLFRIPFEAKSVVAKILTIVLVNVLWSAIMHLVLGMFYGYGVDLTILTMIRFGYNIIFSFAIFWSMQFLSRLKLIVIHE